MVKKLKVTEELQAPYQQLMRLLPFAMQEDIDIQNIVYVYLKLGGERMARHGIEILKSRFMSEDYEELEDSVDLDDDDLDDYGIDL